MSGRVSKKCKRSQANVFKKVLTALGQNIEPLIAVATHHALFATQNTNHTSICDKNENVLLTTNSNACTYLLVIVNIEGIKCRTLVDTGAGASYLSSTIISLINQKTNYKPIRIESKRIETLVSSSIKNIPVYSIELKYINYDFSFKTEISKLEKSVILQLPNPHYREIQNNYQYLRYITFNDYDTKSELPIHMILGTSDYTKIKTPERARIELSGEPIAELTKLGWYIVSFGGKNDIANILFSQTSIQGKPDDYVFEKFRE